MLVATGVFSYCVGSISSILIEINNRKSEYEAYMSKVTKYLKDKQITGEILDKAIS